jgi:hypothetical protein
MFEFTTLDDLAPIIQISKGFVNSKKKEVQSRMDTDKIKPNEEDDKDHSAFNFYSDRLHSSKYCCK